MYQISENFSRELDKLREERKLNSGDTIYVCFSDKADPETYDRHNDIGLNIVGYQEDIPWSEIKYIQLKRDEHLAHEKASDEGMPDPRD